MLLILTFFLPIVTFSQFKITIPRYSIVYTFTNTSQINEVYFDHKQKHYKTNVFYNSENYSVQYKTNTYTFLYKDCVKFQNSVSKYYINNNSKGWPRPSGDYRFYTLKRTYLSNNKILFTTTNKGKTVRSGLWYDHFTDSYITNVDYIEIDHIVPFKEAFRSQKNQWSQEEIEQFYNSTLKSALLPVYSKENQIKRDATPRHYLPPNINFQPIYIDMWIHTKKIYKLHISSNEISSYYQNNI